MIRRMSTAAVTVALTVLLAASVRALQPPSGMEDFKPLSDVAQSEQIPGGTMLLVAYAFIWVGLLVYVWSIWRRLATVEHEIKTLERRTNTGGAAR